MFSSGKICLGDAGEPYNLGMGCGMPYASDLRAASLHKREEQVYLG
jgi:hypothetical protein